MLVCQNNGYKRLQWGVLKGKGFSIYTLLRAPTSSHFFMVNLSIRIFILILPFLTFYIGPFSNFWRLIPNHKRIVPLALEGHF